MFSPEPPIAAFVVRCWLRKGTGDQERLELRIVVVVEVEESDEAKDEGR